MIKIEKVKVYGWEAAVRGMRNPLNSWERSDSVFFGNPYIGENDKELMLRLAKSGTDHGKYLRFLHVSLDAVAPRYWWKEFMTYRIGCEVNSCSTMHTIHKKEFTEDDFSIEHLDEVNREVFRGIISTLNYNRERYLETKNKEDWWQMIQLLPESHNQRRTIDVSYMALMNMYKARNGHKLDEWRDFCKWIETLPLMKELVKDEQSTKKAQKTKLC